jgi:hypothetical protein
MSEIIFLYTKTLWRCQGQLVFCKWYSTFFHSGDRDESNDILYCSRSSRSKKEKIPKLRVLLFSLLVSRFIIKLNLQDFTTDTRSDSPQQQGSVVIVQ